MNQNTQRPSIADYFSDKTLAITGGTGFVGLCLIEKILRSCPKVRQIILLVRPKKGLTIQERVEKCCEAELFSELRKLHPNFTDKIVSVECDLEEENLGLSEESIQFLVDRVNIFFHSAATLRFNEHLRMAFKLNTLAVRRLLKICKQMKHLEALVHLSTAYSHCDREEIGEVPYEVHPKFHDIENAVSWMSDDMITKLTPEIIGKRPNTYTLTKAIGEDLIFSESGDLPVVILRPSIIGPTWNDPMPGWITTLNGPTGIIIASGKGVLQTMKATDNLVLDVIPVDFTVGCAIAAAWKVGVDHTQKMEAHRTLDQLESSQPHEDVEDSKVPGFSHETGKFRKDVAIYNLTTGTYNPNVLNTWHKSMAHWLENYPMNHAFRKPVFSLTNSKYTHRYLMFVYHYVPAYLFDLVLRLLGRKPRLIRLTQKVDAALEVLQYFLNHSFKWKNDNTMSLLDVMSTEDRKTFNFDPRAIDWHEYMKHFAMGARKHILKEDPDSYPSARRHVKRLRIISYFLQSATFLVLWRLLVARTRIAQSVWHLVVSLCFKFLRFFQISSTLHGGSLFSRS